MPLNRVSLSLGLLIAAPALFACRQNPLVKRANPAPKAVAAADALEYPQAPATVMLDGSGSKDDGRIVEFRWLSATPVPGGAGRLVPEGERSDWPPDGEKVAVQVPEGFWTFGLWVKDDQGVTGPASMVTVKVGNPPLPAGGAGGSGP